MVLAKAHNATTATLLYLVQSDDGTKLASVILAVPRQLLAFQRAHAGLAWLMHEE
jgi:hypothetical protein